ncbi:molybdenum-pterin binding domain protein [Lasius niger]|uniref:Molybdenum-pterin binding domain protein n=1 Tax=Lasius niger TaxID=67767 RepID=A0A0J7NDP2_LASNI|nr:molybdenum-pterin binding domain protein [Lasius niger]
MVQGQGRGNGRASLGFKNGEEVMLDDRRDHGTHEREKELSKGYGILLDSIDNIAASITEELKVWQTYIEKLFADDRSSHHEIDILATGPDIMETEVAKAIRQARGGARQTYMLRFSKLSKRQL